MKKIFLGLSFFIVAFVFSLFFVNNVYSSTPQQCTDMGLQYCASNSTCTNDPTNPGVCRQGGGSTSGSGTTDANGCTFTGDSTCYSQLDPPEGSSCDPTSCHFCTGSGCPALVTCTVFRTTRTIANYSCPSGSSYTSPSQCSAAPEVQTSLYEQTCTPATGGLCGNGNCDTEENSLNCIADCPISGGGNNGGGSTNTGSVDIYLYPYSRTIDNGQTTSYMVEIYPISANNLSVNLNTVDCPSGATCSFSGGSSITVTGDNPNDASVYYKSMIVETNSVSSSGSPYTFTVVANYNSGSDSTNGRLYINPPPPPPSVSSLPPNVFMDHPPINQQVSERLYIWGWAIDNENANETAITSRKVYLDNQFIGNANTYSRPDVCAVWPGRAGCPNVGYEFNFDTRNFSNGTHTLKVEVTDSDSTPKTTTLERVININNSPLVGSIFGYKLNGIDLGTNTHPPIYQTVRLNGGSPTTANGYSFDNVLLGTNNTVTVDVPSGWSVGYTLCYGITTCHGYPPTAGNTAFVNIPTNLPSGSRFAHLWWHFTPPIINQGPTITLIGSNPMDILVGRAFNDPGATATDPEDGDITNRIVVSGTVGNSQGVYSRTYRVTDNQGASAQISRTIIRSTGPQDQYPSITLLGDNPFNLTVGQTFNDPGATATDAEDGNITNRIVVSGSVNTNRVGTYTLTYRVQDSEGQAVQVSRTVLVNDIINNNPSITLLGDNPFNLTVGRTFNDPGATATDPEDGDITNRIVVTGSVNTNTAGNYILTYSVQDSMGRSAQVSRTVIMTNVPINNDPSITILGDNPFTLRAGQTFNDPGATATDPEDGNITGSIRVTGSVNTSRSGTYTLTYTVSDSGGKTVSATRTVVVNSAINNRPSIELNGSDTVNIRVGDNFNDPGARATDQEDGNLTGSIVVGGSVNTGGAGTYTKTYTVTDSGGSSSSITRTIIVSPPIQNHTINITRPLGGNVNSNDSNISCGTVCSATYTNGSVVTLTASPQSGWRFVGWTGDCSGVSSCTITVNSPKNIGALFRPQPFQYKEF